MFAWQHDPEALGSGLYTFFDDESANANGSSLRRTAGWSRCA